MPVNTTWRKNINNPRVDVKVRRTYYFSGGVSGKGIGVHFGLVCKVAVLVDQHEHKLLRFCLQGTNVVPRGERHNELCHLSNEKV